MSESKQRWRLIFRRDAPAMYLSHLDAIHAWERGLRRGRIPVAKSEGFSPRPKLAFAAPLQLGMLAEHELADLFLAERMTAPDLRERLESCLPPGYVVTDLHDVWVGAPAVAPQLAAADYRATVSGAHPERLRTAATRVIQADTLLRERRRDKGTTRYDLRPLILELRCGEGGGPIAAAPGHAQHDAPELAGGSTTSLWMRLRHSQERGTGRMEEVVAALAEELGLRYAWLGADDAEGREASAAAAALGASNPSAPPREIEVLTPVRERLWLEEELAPPSRGAASTV